MVVGEFGGRTVRVKRGSIMRTMAPVDTIPPLDMCWSCGA